jgi:hypothetical protein
MRLFRGQASVKRIVNGLGCFSKTLWQDFFLVVFDVFQGCVAIRREMLQPLMMVRTNGMKGFRPQRPETADRDGRERRLGLSPG